MNVSLAKSYWTYYMLMTSILEYILFTDSLTEEEAKELVDWMSIILGKQKVSLVKV